MMDEVNIVYPCPTTQRVFLASGVGSGMPPTMPKTEIWPPTIAIRLQQVVIPNRSEKVGGWSHECW